MMPSTHHFLATLFSKILLHSQVPPTSWTHAKIITLHKKGDHRDPANFRPIVLTSVIGKLFHKILAIRLEDFLISNSMVDKSLQKGFLRGVNGCIEHVFAIQAMVQNAMEHSLPLALSFIDLKNEFGSILHAYLKDMLKLIKLPREFTDYVSSLYSSISAHVFTKHWKTQHFSITKGVFQGDTLSPLLFLIAINPLIQSVALYPASRGFALKLPIQSELQEQPLPKPNRYAYALWDEKNSDEVTGWYLAKVQSVDDNGECTLQYRRGKLIEMAN